MTVHTSSSERIAPTAAQKKDAPHVFVNDAVLSARRARGTEFLTFLMRKYGSFQGNNTLSVSGPAAFTCTAKQILYL